MSLNKLAQSIGAEKKPLVIVIIFLLASIVTPSHVLLFILSSIFFLVLLFSTESILKTIFYGFFPFWLLDVGRVFSFVAVPAGAIFNPIYPNGRSIFFSLSPFFVFAVVTIAILYALIIKALWNNFKKANHKSKSDTNVFNNKYLVFFVITFFVFFLSSSLTNFFPELSLLYSLEEYSAFSWMIISVILLRKASREDCLKILTTFFLILFSMLILEAGVTYLQFAKHGVIGIVLEKQTSIPTFGFGVDEDTTSFRPIGLSYHANSLANWMVTLLSSMVLVWFAIKDTLTKRISNFLIIASVAISTSVIIITISRSAFLSLAIYLFILFAFDKSEIAKAFRFTLSYLNNLKIPILIALIFFVYLVGNRAYYSIFALSSGGGLTTRINQISDALKIFQRSPFLGIGNGMYISASYFLNPDGPVRYFPENVHNGFLLLLGERGLISLIFYFLGLAFLLKAINSKFTKTLKVITVAGFSATFAMMLFQPFVNLFSLNILTACILLGIKTNGQIAKK